MNCELKILDSFLFYEIIDMIQVNPNLQTPQNIFFLSGIMGGENMNYWTNFDILKEVKRICGENKISYWTKGHIKVVVEILDLLGEIILSSSPSQEEKFLINNFKNISFRVMEIFKPYKNN